MKNNPYTDILDIIEDKGSKNNPPSIQLGKVTSINPLKIKIGDLILEKYNLLVNENLLKHTRKISIKDGCNGDVNGYHGRGTLTNIDIKKSTEIIETTLTINNTVAVLSTQDRQTYIVLAKVV